MPLPDDLKNYKAEDDDAFQLMPPHVAGWGLFAIALFLWAIEPILK